MKTHVCACCARVGGLRGGGGRGGGRSCQSNQDQADDFCSFITRLCFIQTWTQLVTFRATFQCCRLLCSEKKKKTFQRRQNSKTSFALCEVEQKCRMFDGKNKCRIKSDEVKCCHCLLQNPSFTFPFSRRADARVDMKHKAQLSSF